jgi:DNA-binding MarR family transcriptional regulator
MYDWSDIHRAWVDPGPGGENLRFQDFPSFHMMTLANLAKASVSRACLEPAGLSVPEWRLLTTLVGGEPVPFSQIASLTLMDKGQISRTLRTAQSKGLVETDVAPLERRPQDAGVSSIGRVMVRITQAGREVYARVMPEAQRSQLRLIALMSPEERRMVVDLGRRLYELLMSDLRARS